MTKSIGSYAMLLVLVLTAVTCSRSKPASKTPSAVSLGQSPAAFAGRLGDAMLGGAYELIYEGPCVDGQHNVEHCGDCHYVSNYFDVSGVCSIMSCSQCASGRTDRSFWSATGTTVHDLGSATCNVDDKQIHQCSDGQQGVESCGACFDFFEIAYPDNTTSLRCLRCNGGQFATMRWQTLAAGESVANLGDFGCSPVLPYGGPCIDGHNGVDKCGSCSLISTVTNSDGTKEITCMKCSAGSLSSNLEPIKVSDRELVGDLGAWACGEPQPPHDYEGPCVDGKNNIGLCGSCRAIKAKLRDDGKAEIECTECSAGFIATELIITLKQVGIVADMGIHGCERSEDYSGECVGGLHHVNSCGSCQAISVVTNLDQSVDVQCTQCRPNGKKDHIKKGERTKVPDLGEFGCNS